MALLAFGAALAHGALAATPRIAASSRAFTVSATKGASVELTLEDAPAGVEYLAETSFGSLSTVEETSPGRYVTRMTVPPTDMPRSVVVVLSPQGRPDADVAFSLVPVVVTTKLAARTEPRAQVSAKVGAREFGPVEAARDGSFELELSLAPGDAEALIHIADSAGNITTSKLPTPVRAHDPLTVTLDRYRVPSDGTGDLRVFALTFDQLGRPIPNAKLAAAASMGTLGPFEDRGDGVHEARYTPPADGSEGIATIDVSLSSGGATHRETEQVSVVRGKPSQLVLVATPTEVVAGSGTEISLVATVADAAGKALPGKPVRIVTDRGTPSDVIDRGDGTYESKLATPDAVESGSIEVKALLSTGSPTKPPARIELIATPTVVPTSWRAFALVTAKILDADGRPVAGELVLFHLARGEGRLTPVSVSLTEGQAFADFAADPTEEAVTIEATSTSVPSLTARVQIEKRSTGDFAIVSRPAQAAQGGRASASIDLADGERVLQDTALITILSGAPSKLVATADPSRLPADGQATSTITALLTDERGNEVLDQQLAWSVDRGRIEPATTDGEGGYTATFTSPDGAGTGSATIHVSHAASGLSASVSVALDPTAPRHLALALDPASLDADGASQARVTATLTDASGVAVPGIDVDFSIGSGDATIDPAGTTNAAGQAAATLVAGNEPGDVAIEAKAHDGALSATARLELRPLGPATLEAAASPASILADDRERSEITATVEDPFGNPMAGEPIEFTASLGTLTARQARSDSLGMARVYLSGLVPGTSTIRARSIRNASLEESVVVTLRPATPLSAAFTVAQPACSGAVTLTATGADATTWSWEWTGDGQPDSSLQSVVASLPFGTTSVQLTVTDAAGRSTTGRQDVAVLASPTAVATATPPAAASGASVTLDAAGSVAADGGPLAFSWDLDGDGAADATGATTTWTRPDGAHVARLTVTDQSGCAATKDVSVVFGMVPDLAVDVSAVGGVVVLAGEEAGFEIAWRNEGTVASDGVVIDVTLGNLVLTALPGGGTRLSDTRAEFLMGPLAPGASGVIMGVRARAATQFPGQSLSGSLQARIAGTPDDLDQSDNTDAAFVTITRKVDLDVALAAPASVQPGAPIEIVMTVRNLTVAAATDAEASLSWDAALIANAVVASAEAVQVDQQAGSATIDLGDLGGGASATITLRGDAPLVFATIDPILGVDASAWHAGPDADGSNNTRHASVAYSARPNLAVSLEANPSREPLQAGDRVELKATYRNDGAAPALGVTLTHRLSPGLVATLVQNPDNGILSGDEVEFDLGDVPPRTSGVRRFTAKLVSEIDPQLRNLQDECEIEDALHSIDPPPVDTLDSVTIAVDPGAPALATTIALPSAARAGDSVVALVTVTNSGARASGVELDLAMSGALVTLGASDVALTASTSGDPSHARVTIATLAAGASATWRLDLTLPCPQASINPTLAATASALIGGMPSGAAASAALALEALPDLALTLGAPATALPGQDVSLVPQVTNLGCAPATSGRVDATWPGDVATGSPVVLTLPAIAPGVSPTLAPFTASVRRTQASTSNVVIVDAAVSPADPDASGANDTARAAIVVRAAPDVAITLPGALARVDAGASADVTVDVDNLLGSTSAAGVVVTLAADDPSLIESITPASQTLSGLVAGAAPTSVTFRVTTAATLPLQSLDALLTARASAAGDANPANDQITFPLPLGASPDLSVTMTVTSSPSPAEPGAIVTARIDVDNIGSADSSAFDLDVPFDTTVLDPAPGTVLPIRMAAIPAHGRAPPQVLRFTVKEPLPAGVVQTTITAVATEPADANTGNNTATVSLLVDSAAIVDVAVDISLVASNPLDAGGSVLAQMSVSSLAPRVPTGVTLTVTWPDALAAVTGASPGASTGAGSATWPVDFAANPSGVVHSLNLDVRDVLPGVSNAMPFTATLTLDPIANPQVNLSNDTDSASVTAVAAAKPCVTLVATTAPNPAAELGDVTYDLVVTNDGTTAAAPCVVDLAVDPRLTGAGARQFTIPSLAARNSQPFSATFTLPALGAGQNTAIFMANARATAPQANPPDACQQTSDVPVVLTRLSDLAIVKTLRTPADPPPRRGSILDYRLVITNLGSQPTTIDRVVDVYPPETSVALSSGVDSGGQLTWDGAAFGTINPGASVTIDYSLQVLAGLPAGDHVLRNVATVFNTVPDGSAGNDTATVSINMPLDVDLEVKLEATELPAPAVPGSTIRYDATIWNHGAYPATNAQLTVDLGPLMTLATGATTIPLGIIPPGDSTTATWTATSAAVMSAEHNAATVTATATSDLVDARPGDESDSVTTMIDAVVDLKVSSFTCLSAGGPPFQAGETYDCSVVVQNFGTLIAAGAAVNVSFDAVDLVVNRAGSFTPGGAGQLTTTFATFSPADGPRTLDFTLQAQSVLPSPENPVSTCVSATPVTADRFPNDNLLCVDRTILATPDVVVALAASAPTNPAAPGQDITYDLTVTNVGSTIATGVTILQPFDPSVVTGLVNNTDSRITQPGNAVSVVAGSIAAGGPAFTARYQLRLAGAMPLVQGSVDASACATLDDPDPTPGDDCGSASIAFRASVDAFVGLTPVSATPTAAGQTFTVSASWGNLGTAPARSAVIDVQLDPLVDFVSDGVWSSPAPGVIRRTVASLPADGATTTAMFRVTVKSPLPDAANTPCFNASITHADPAFELDAANDTFSLCVNATACADLAVAITRTSLAPTPGSTVAYRVSYRNDGTTTARGATLTIDDPDFATPVGLGADAVLSLGDVPPAPDPLAVGFRDLAYTIAGTFPSTTNTITGNVVAATTTPECGVGANADSWSDVLTARPNMWSTLSIASAANPTSACATVTATIDYGNSGQAAAPATLALLYDGNLLVIVDAAGGTPNPGGNEIDWTFASLAAGFTGSLTVTFQVKCVLPALSNPMFFASEMETTASDPFPGDDADTAQLIATAAPDLIARVTYLGAVPDPAGAGSTLRFQCSVENAGSTRANNVQLEARWQDPVLIASAQCAGCGPSNVATWPIGPLDVAPGAPVTVDLVLVAAATFPAVTNTLTVTSTASALEPDSDAASNTGSTTATLVGKPDLRLTVSSPLGSNDIRPDLLVTYRYIIRNVGSAPAQDVILTSTFDDEAFGFSGATSGTVSGDTVTFQAVPTFAPNAASPLRAAVFLANDLAPPPVARTIDHSAHVEEGPPFGPSRDANPVDNDAALAMRGCYLDAYIHSTSLEAICQGASVTLVARTAPTTGLTYQWTVDGNMGAFSSTTTSVTTYTPPTTATNNNYRVHCLVTDTATGCAKDATIDVFTDATCSNCGCPNPIPHIDYVPGSLSRLDRPGDRNVGETETVAFVARMHELNPKMASTILAGQSTMSFGRRGSGPRYVATLVNDVYLDCTGLVELEFTASQVPVGLVVGGAPTSYEADFAMQIRDACGVQRANNEDSAGDMIVVSPSTLRAAPGIEFTDWGPSQRP